jgi:hypothetical protein
LNEKLELLKEKVVSSEGVQWKFSPDKHYYDEELSKSKTRKAVLDKLYG